MLNIAAIMGRLTADPELRQTPNNVPVTSFTVAVARSFVKQGQERQTDFINVVAWGKTAEFVCRYFKKGNLIAVDGSIQARKYQDKAGNNRTAVEIVAANVNFCGKQETGPVVETPMTPLVDFADVPGDLPF
ncbi:single-stranded DNA-binding protein [Acetanaerobacterium sp. MSJ-12]|uniref:single-stranded DNA-binding protein n=1 Tax=Acetanaerobacterium sp. MSJ-12 TaxID=2841535 RepID=UPI001C0EC6A8|nr:single-stranded DNA-binding protein [Acetanaerobacterium sp. MSJ-12]MBU5419629.1 single-stranded DNA-binding protein [Acetanaerobacterium sp. MSJ-12]